jgi:membrane-associated protease RseP (regulator of RpoE activity)
MSNAPARTATATQPEPEAAEPHRFDPRINLACFVATVVTVFWVAPSWGGVVDRSDLSLVDHVRTGWPFAVPLLAILLCHEFGHYFAARWHRVPASLPYFIPIPLGLGTFGAVIAVPERIRSRNVLLDFSAAGPLAGLAVALVVLALGLSWSPVMPLTGSYLQEGQSLLYLGLKYLVLGPIPDGHDVALHPTAAAGWAGLLLTMLNLMPYGQLDGGHIAYALLGKRHTTLSRWVRWGVLALFIVQVARFGTPILLGSSDRPWYFAFLDASTWLVWFTFLTLLRRSQDGDDHPETDDAVLSPGRRRVAWLCAVLFVLLFMPTPMSQG